MNKSLFAFVFAFIAALLASCSDELIYNVDDPGEGEAAIAAELSFKNFTPALDGSRATGGTDGAVLDGIDNLNVFVFSADGTQLIAQQSFTKEQLTITTNSSTPSGSIVVTPGALPTEMASFKFNLPFGRYKIYAAANVPVTAFTPENTANETALKAIRFGWNSTTISANDQMFGFFSDGSNTTGEPTSDNFSAPVVTVGQASQKLTGWLHRLASKVTVAYDGSGLKQNVYIFLKSLEIKDIPQSCALGVTNTPEPGDLISEGQTIYYYDRQAMPNGPSASDYTVEGYEETVAAGSGILGSDHGHTANALFFYENNQGIGKNKGQDVITNGSADLANGNYGSGSSDGVIDFPDGNNPDPNTGFKDEKRAGTYIEVKAFYRSENVERIGQGEIVYRFMLGKDVTTSYEALRNHHFKLTLKFNGWANDVDWHIEYDEQPQVMTTPNPYYISYLYKQSMMLPLNIVTGGAEIASIEAEIVSNGWAPMNATGLGQGKQNGDYSFTANQDADARFWRSLFPEYKLYWEPMDQPRTYPWNGFLSLKKVEATNVVEPQPWTVNSNKSHYESNSEGKVAYSGDDLKVSDFSIDEAMENGKLHVSKTDNGYIVNMPMWTRAKNLVKQTAYTGNNPFVDYYRESKIKVKATLNNGTVLYAGMSDDKPQGEEISIQQVQRLVNPKGIWRRGNNNASFSVDIKTLRSVNDTRFTSLRSIGPWRAYVYRDTKRTNSTNLNDATGTIQLEGAAGTTTGSIDLTDSDGKTHHTYQTIEGGTGSYMRFNVKFNGTTSDDNPNYAIIRLEYNNYTCYHLIFVRQGYGADNLYDGGDRWETKNNVAKDVLADSPLDEGSMFKAGNWNDPIDSWNNVNGEAKTGVPAKSPWVAITPNNFELNAAKAEGALSWNVPLRIYNSDKTETWEGITYTPIESNKDVTLFSGQSNLEVATLEQYLELYRQKELEEGFGVLYGDESTATLENIDDVYGYLPSRNPNKNRGMRGCFVYNTETGKNLFFPIGASGYGHRKSSVTRTSIWNSITTFSGVLRYSSNARWGYFDAQSDNYPNGIDDAPLFFDIFRSQGAVYYFQANSAPKKYDDLESSSRACAWDINYYTFDFSPIMPTNVDKGASACFIRSIRK